MIVTRTIPRLRVAALCAAAVIVATSRPVQAEAAIFAERAAELGVRFTHQNGMTGELYFAEMMGAGAALFDADGDGDLDLYLVQGGPFEPQPEGVERPSDRLYRNDLGVGGDGMPRPRFVDVTAAAGLAGATGYGMGVAAGDVDNDGRIDLYLANFGANQLWRNVSTDQGIRFEEITAASGTEDPRWSVPALFFDADADGWLDLYVGNYVDFRLATHKTCSSTGGAPDYCSPNAFRPEPDRLLRGLGPGRDGVPRFEDVTRAAGLAEPGAALGAVTGDFDGDGRIDLYVANDGMANRLYLNRSAAAATPRFADEALIAGTAVNQAGQPEASMGVIAGDVDGNGSLDLFMTHLDRETNTLYLNDGTGLFDDRSRDSGLGNASWRFTGFGTALADFDVDGELDLMIANGAVTIVESRRAAGSPHPLEQSDLYFRGLGHGRFAEATAAAGEALARLLVSRGVATGDLDNDGDPDLVVTTNGGPALVLVNATDPPPSAWLGIRLVTADGKRDALGARATVTVQGGAALRRQAVVGGSYASSSDPRLLFGLGTRAASGEVEVVWPDGRCERFTGVLAGRYQSLRQGTGTVCDAPQPAVAKAVAGAGR